MKSVKDLVHGARSTFVRFPLVLLSSFAAGAYGIYMVEAELSPASTRIPYALTLGIALFLATSLYRESRGLTAVRAGLIELVGGAIFLGAYYALTRHDGTNNFFIRHLHLSLAAHLLIAFVPFVGARAGFWQFNRYLFLCILLSALYAAVFFGGVAIALFTIQKLFSFKISDKRFAELWFFSVFVLQTWHFLAGVPRLKELEGDRTYPRGLRVFVQYLLIPLVSLYTLILYTYMTKILLTRDWPSGSIGWLVSIMSVLGIFNLLLIDPEKEKSESRWIQTYSKAYYVLILPLLVMLFIAIGKRVAEYGITEQRYFLCALGALLAGLATYFILSTKKNIKVIPVSLFVVSVLTLWGPWSAYEVSLRDQLGRASALIDKNRAAKISLDEERELTSILEYVLRNHGAKPLARWFPPEVLAPLEQANARTLTAHPLMQHLGLKYVNDRGTIVHERFIFRSDLDKEIIAIAGYSDALEFNFRGESASAKWFSLRERKLRLEIVSSPPSLNIVGDDDRAIASFPIEPMFKAISASRALSVDSSLPALPSREMTIDSIDGALKARVILRLFSGEVSEGKVELQGASGLVLIK